MATAAAARAHDRSMSYSTWYLSQGRARVELKLRESDVAALPLVNSKDLALGNSLAQYAVSHLTILHGDQRCEIIEQPRRLAAPPGRVVIQWTVALPDEGPLSIHSDLFYDQFVGHLHFVNLRYVQNTGDRVLSSRERQWNIGSDASVVEASTSTGEYFVLGVEHIVTGYDHLIFLFALLLSGGTFCSLVKVVTGFTVGHSITLGIAALGLVKPEIAPIEALIGLSISLVAVENVWLLGSRNLFLPVGVVATLCVLAICSAAGIGRISTLSCLGLAIFLACYYPLLCRTKKVDTARWMVALIFGLIHGFGFASVLQAAGLSPDRVPSALLGFNLGVEAGQLALVCIAWLLFCSALKRWGGIVIEVGSSIALGFGLYWLLARAYM